jgi:hypothetical protein
MLVLSAGCVSIVPLTGCEDLPGDPETQGAVAGGVGGAVAGAVIGGEDNRLLGALIGGALGAGGGYLIGSQVDKVDDDDEEGAKEAVENAQSSPATADQARRADSADVNRDGFVTLDEVVAMEKAGFSNTEMIDRLEKTNQIFELNNDQERYLTSRGVDRVVIEAMEQINRDEKERVLGTTNNNADRTDVIGR